MDLVIFMSLCLSIWTKAVTLFLLLLSFKSVQNFQYIVLPAQCMVASSVILSVKSSLAVHFNVRPSRHVPVYLPTVMSMHANMHQFPFTLLCAFLLTCMFHPSLQLCETSCVCLLYLVYLLQESRLSAATPSLHIHHVQTPILPEEDNMSSPWVMVTESTAR